MGFFELFEIGFIGLFFTLSNLYLTLPMYIFLALGFAVQFLVLNKRIKLIFRFATVIALSVCVILCEILWQSITGWERLAIDVAYMLVLCLIIGVLFAFTVYYIIRTVKKYKHKNKGV